ncbi:MAG: membrane protein insertase YidC [Candidatus Binatia bacterium]
MEKRAFLAIALSLLVLVLYQEWITRQYGTTPPPPQQVEKTEPGKPQTAESVPPSVSSPSAAAEIKPVQTPAGQPAKDIRIETDNYVAVLTSQGARLKSFKFKHYRATGDPKSPPFEMIPTVPGVPYPLGVKWNNAASVDDSDIVYRVDAEDLKLSGDTQGTLIFQGIAQGGATITKKLTFSGARYPIDLQVTAKAADGSALAPALMLTAPSNHQNPSPDAPFEGLIAVVDNKIKREHVSDELKQGKEFTGDLSWAGFGYTYFFMGLVPADGAGYKLTLQEFGPALILTVAEPSGKSETRGRYTLFAGPKELSVLESVGKGMERAIDFGYFGFISIPFLYVLHFFHRFTGSYGIDIILLTVVLKLLTAPLTHKSYVSMKQMQKLQPQMEKLKEKYKDDREKLNKEIMEMYRRNGVNPLGGCLPMVVQFPVFIGLYNALYIPIELRHASFLWIQDLSRPDWESLPFTLAGWHLGVPVLTILMGASMFLQQWMTPTAGDPNQRKLMLMMPLIFTFMFVTFPAGLTIYWLVNNVLSIAQQYWINRRVK